MKKSIFILITISLLLQSCYRYRVIDKNSNLIDNKKYKIKLTNKYQKVRLLSSTESKITIIDNKRIECTIAKNDIKVIKKRQFSYTKTTLLPIGIVVVGVATIFAVGESQGSSGFSPH